MLGYDSHNKICQFLTKRIIIIIIIIDDEDGADVVSLRRIVQSLRAAVTNEWSHTVSGTPHRRTSTRLYLLAGMSAFINSL